MAQTSMTVRLDKQQKAVFDELCAQFGMSANTAINIFVKAVIRTQSIPFSIKAKEEDEVTANWITPDATKQEASLSQPSPEGKG